MKYVENGNKRETLSYVKYIDKNSENIHDRFAAARFVCFFFFFDGWKRLTQSGKVYFEHFCRNSFVLRLIFKQYFEY